MMDLFQLYKNVRQHSVDLCQPLQIEDFVVQPSLDVSPPKWHLAHCTWFWEEFVLAPYLSHYKRYHPDFSYLFNSYYNSVGERILRLDRGNMSRPTVKEIISYREYVDQHMLRWLALDLPKEQIEVVKLGLNHEQQHQELLLTDIKYILGNNPLFPVYASEFLESNERIQKESFIEFEEGIYEIGYKGNDFYFDNEGPSHKVLLPDFSISNQLVSNSQYLEFIEDGGYHHHEWWHSDGWLWVKEHAISAPLYWHKIDTIWYRYSLSGLQKINPEEPVTHISHYEAYAYAEWKDSRLPTEFEWETASQFLNWGSRWEHTSSAYQPYPGYKRAKGAIGEYNGKFMINQMVLRGSSIATPTGHARSTYRNFFHPHLRWQFNGIRLCKRK